MNNCPICNGDIDESYANGLWDLSTKICDEVCGFYNYANEQDAIYNILRDWIENEKYCPRCGKIHIYANHTKEE